MRKAIIVIPAMILLIIATILLTSGVFRAISLFLFLSFVPGFVILKVLNLKEISLLSTFLFSIGLSLISSMLVGLLINELYIFLNFSEPLSVIPLTVAMSTFTLIVFFIGCRRNFSLNFEHLDEIGREIKTHLPLTFVLILIPLLGIIGALYVNIPIMTFLVIIIAILCVLSVVSEKLVPKSYFPFLIFSISISLLCLNVLLSKQILGGDDCLEYYVFKLTQIRGYWGPISPALNHIAVLNFNSMLSVTLLPNMYSVLSGLQDEILFKILYPFIFSLVPLILYGIFEKQTGKMIGLLSALFFVFTSNAFFGELITVDRQIVGSFFLVLSIYVWLDKTIPTTKKKMLLIVFGAALIISHYSIAFIYLGFLALVVLVSSIKTKFDNIFTAVTCLIVFGFAFLWYAFTNSSSVLTGFTSSIETAFSELINSQTSNPSTGTAAVIYGLPQSFTVASWINLAITGVATLFLIIGLIIVIFCPRKTGISDQFRLFITVGGVILLLSLLAPGVAATLNFTRFYAIAILLMSPCFVIGGKTLIEAFPYAWMKIKKALKKHSYFENKHTKMSLLLVSILLSAYLLSQSGFVNNVTSSAIRSPPFDFQRMKTSSDPQVAIQFYGTYIQTQDAYSAFWLLKFADSSSIVYADSSSFNVLASCALTPSKLIHSLDNSTITAPGNFIYLNFLNVVRGIVPNSQGPFNISVISSSIDRSNSIYFNGNSELWVTTGAS